MYQDELYHHGVKGMKWGVRKKYVSEAKKNMKIAKKEYNKAFNRAHNYSSRHMIGQYTNKKKKAESNRRWNEARDKVEKYNTAKSIYKAQKKNKNTKISIATDEIEAAVLKDVKKDIAYATNNKKAVDKGRNVVNKYKNISIDEIEATVLREVTGDIEYATRKR